MPKVSIIVPVYNVEQYLEKCLDSLVNQTLEDIEIIVINDGSPDHSQDIIDRYAKKYRQIRSVIKENGGISSVRNHGIKVASGEYIGFVDGDDYAELNMFETLYHLAKENDANVACCGYYLTYEDRDVAMKEYHYQNTREMLTRFYGVLWDKIYKREFVQKMDFCFPEKRRFEDSFYLTHMALYCDKFVFTDEPLIHYVQRSSSLTTTRNSTSLDAVYMLNELKKYYESKDKAEEYHDELEYVFIKFCLGNPFISSCKIPDKVERKEALDLLWDTLNTSYPNWKKNHYLNELPGLKHKYFKHLNRTFYNISAFIYSHR